MGISGLRSLCQISVIETMLSAGLLPWKPCYIQCPAANVRAAHAAQRSKRLAVPAYSAALRARLGHLLPRASRCCCVQYNCRQPPFFEELPMAVNTAKVEGRRKVTYTSFEDLLVDADRLSAGPVKTLGNWSAGQI